MAAEYIAFFYIDGVKYGTLEYWQQPDVYGNNMETFFDILRYILMEI